jgi:isoprenylcysteine carboxyl methyltransferase (ICMT) family protein YpbQ
MIRASTVVDCCWGALGIYWLYSALGTKKVDVNEAVGLRVLRLSILASTLVLLLTDWLRMRWLGWRFIPERVDVIWTGTVLTAMGVALAIWARWSLGQNWSDKVVLKVDHELIRSGPYAYLRHPIYTAVLLAAAGTALTIGEWRGVVALVLLGMNYLVKAKREEKILAENFGTAFEEYRRQTWFFLPGL